MAKKAELVERQNRVWSRMQEIQRAAEQQDDWTTEQRTNWDAADDELTQVSGDIERLDRAAELESIDYRQVADARVPAEERPEPTDEQREKSYADAFYAYARRGMQECSPEQQRLLRDNFVGESRAQGAGTATAGGYLVPEGFRMEMTETQKAFGGLMNLANVITTSTGNPLPWPTNDDTGNVGAILGENVQIAEQDLTLGQSELGAYTYTSKLVRVSWQLLDDSAFDLPSFLSRKLGERIGRAQAPHLVSGDGSAKPTGIVSAATAGVTGAVSATAAITYDNLIDLEHSVDPAYRDSGRTRYVLSDGALKLIRKLKDGDNRPLWVPVPAPGFPSTINGYPYTVDNSMAAPVAAGRSILFGDVFAGLIVRVVQGVQMVRLQERYADYLQTGFFGFSRMDAKPDDAAAVKVFVHGAAS